MITPTLVSELTLKGSPTSLYRESNMDPYLHTIIAVVMLYAFYLVGNFLGKQRGVEATLIWAINHGLCTEEDLRKLNEKLSEEE